MEVAFRDGRLDSWSPVAFVTEFPRPVFDYTLRMAAEWPDQAVVLTRSIAAVHLANSGRFRDAQELTGQLARVWPPDLEATHDVSLDGNWRNEFGDLYIALAFTEYGLGLSRAGAPVSAGRAAREHDHNTLFYDRPGPYVASCARSLPITPRRSDGDARRRTTRMTRIARHRAPCSRVRGSTCLARHSGCLKGRGLTPTPSCIPTSFLATVPPRWPAERTIQCRSLPSSASSRDGVRKRWTSSDACCQMGRRPSRATMHSMPRSTSTTWPRHWRSIVGDVTTARAWLVAHDRWLAWSGAVLGQVQGHLGWARYHRQAGDLDAAEAQAQTAFEQASNPRQPLGLIASHRLLGELATERGNHESAATHLSASLALADACAAPFERALTLVAQAELASRLVPTLVTCSPTRARSASGWRRGQRWSGSWRWKHASALRHERAGSG